MTVSGVVVMYRKRALMDIGLWDRDMATEDIAVTWKLERANWRVHYEPRALCYMLVPETLRGLFKQRRRWAQGGQEVIKRHLGVFVHAGQVLMWPIYLEQICSLIWSLMWVALVIVELVLWPIAGPIVFEFIWKSQFLCVLCLVQFLVALILEHKYVRRLDGACLPWHGIRSFIGPFRPSHRFAPSHPCSSIAGQSWPRG